MTEIAEMTSAEVAALAWESVASSNVARIAHVGRLVCSGCGAGIDGDGRADHPRLEETLRAGGLVTCTAAGARVVVREDNDLFVEFSNGSLYRYIAVPAEDYQALLDAHLQEGGSVGRTLHRRIKGHFPIVKVAVTKETEEGVDSGDR